MPSLPGFMTSDVKMWMEDMKNSNLAVMEMDHTVVFNWNDDAVHMLRQATVSKEYHRGGVWSRPVVIVVDGKGIKRTDVEEQIRRGFHGLPNQLHLTIREVREALMTTSALMIMVMARMMMRMICG